MYYSDELYHHGIKGQRWGRRNGPPYPLSPQTHASVVRSAGRGGYTGTKSSKKGKIGGVKDHLLANSVFDKSDTGREAYRENLKANAKSAVGTGIGAGVGAGIGAGVAALRKGNIKEGAVYGGLAGSALGSLAGTRSYIKSLKLGAKRHKEIREADRAKKGRIGGMSPEEEKAARRKRILRNVAIGAGAAAALGGAGYLAYRNRQRILSRRLKGSAQQTLNGPVQSPWSRATVVGDGSGAIVPVRSVGRAAPNFKANLGKTGRKARSVVTPTTGLGKKYKFTTKSTNTGIVPVNTNRSLGYLAPERRSINWRRVGLAGAGAVGLGGGTAAGVSAYRRRKKKRSSRR